MDLQNLDNTVILSLTEKLEQQLAQTKRFTSEVVEQSTKLFENYPNLVAVRWLQYTPAWNDGDACEFTVSDVGFRFEDTEEDKGDYEDGFLNVWAITYPLDYDKEPITRFISKSSQCSGLTEFSTFICNSEHILESVFGNNQTITINRDLSVEVESYASY